MYSSGPIPVLILTLQGVTVTQSGVVLSTVFVATLIFTPIFGKEFTHILINNFKLFVIKSKSKSIGLNFQTESNIPVHSNSGIQKVHNIGSFYDWSRQRKLRIFG